MKIEFKRTELDTLHRALYVAYWEYEERKTTAFRIGDTERYAELSTTQDKVLSVYHRIGKALEHFEQEKADG